MWHRLRDLATRNMHAIIVDPRRIGASTNRPSLGAPAAARSRRLLLAHLALLAETENRWGPYLIAAPAAELQAWVADAAHACPALKILPYWGDVSVRARFRRFWRGTGTSLYSQHAQFHLVITSLEILATDLGSINHKVAQNSDRSADTHQ